MRLPMNPIELSIGAYYLASFAVIGVSVPYIALWLDSRGASAGWIGAVVAAPSLVSLVTTPLLGIWADRLGSWRQSIIMCNWATLLALSWWWFSTDSLAIALVWVIVGTLTLGTSPITDAASLSVAKRGELDFGRVRGLGSFGYILAVIACGALFDAQGPDVFLTVLSTCVLLRALLAHRLPRVTQLSAARGAAQGLTQPPAPGFLAVLVGAALINASHATFYTFGLLHWKSVGISTQLGSALFTVGVVFEIVLMWRFAAIARRFSARFCLLLAAACSAFRWAVTAQDPALPVLLILQSLHAISFGLTFLAVVNFIARRTPDSRAAGAQAMNAALGTAVMAMTTLLSGKLYELFGGSAYLAMAGLCILAMVLIALSYRLRLEPATIAT